MNFESFSAFLAMGGHGPYVWSCYGLTLAVLLFNGLAPGRRKRRFLREQGARQRRQEQPQEQA
ncbi:MAG: heme exporter protein CcmD [Pseudomonadales bacterium]|nr:heme exporter protein CcmD [Pseudomonadales bacterium]